MCSLTEIIRQLLALLRKPQTIRLVCIHVSLKPNRGACPCRLLEPEKKEVRYLSLGDDVEGASLLSLPDDILPLVVVFLIGRGRDGGGGTTIRTEGLH